MFEASRLEAARALLAACRAHGVRIAVAESCTGGLIAALLTEIAGSSDVFERGFVTYSNDAKAEQLGVPRAMIDRHGAVSPEVAIAMAQGALRRSKATLSVAVTGVAGPGGGSSEKPAGLVHIASCFGDRPPCHEIHHFAGHDRATVRMLSVDAVLRLLALQIAPAA